ncbi:dienelactone hydrolase family protein [Amaricoccus sp. W119]|uniref:dienelactone hydrolase family protein n=1 Tax=Amaricoccus sp. W119 TaxID=3391833 RepID=UPI0039A6D392
MPRVFLLGALACGISAGSAWAEDHKRPPRDEELAVPSVTLTDTQFLRIDPAAGTPVVLSATLRLPNWDARLPAVVLLHGSDGVTSGAVANWRGILDKLGVATLRLDSFTARGITDVETDQSQLGFYNQVYDAHRAVEVLAADGRIDPDRIVLMGFSRGGTAALYAAMVRFQSAYRPTRGEIAAYLPFYPSCGVQLDTEDTVVDAPIRVFHGAADDWVPITPCENYIARLRAEGHDATLTEYSGVRHAFDNPGATAGFVVEDAPTARTCARAERCGVIVNLGTGEPFSFSDACVEYGPSVGYDERAAKNAAEKVGAILRQVFAPL